MKAEPPDTQPGCVQFAELCHHLIEEVGHNYLYPEITRRRSTDWMAYIFEHCDQDRKVRLASGQAETMDEACALCVADYHEQRRIEARKAELRALPEVQEALALFGLK